MPWQRPHRFWRHAFRDEADVRRAFGPDGILRVEKAIEDGEARHRGQVVVALESSLPLLEVLRHHSPQQRALEVFGLLRVWDTEENCGVLVYLLFADRDVEIVADRGIHRKVGDGTWQAICQRMETAFRAGHYAEGLEAGVAEISQVLAEHFPGDGRDRNELPNRPVIL